MEEKGGGLVGWLVGFLTSSSTTRLYREGERSSWSLHSFLSHSSAILVDQAYKLLIGREFIKWV